MRKNFFTGKAKRKLPPRKPRSNSEENLARSWYSTDPKDLVDGFTVGSMSVPYPPPSPEPEEKHESYSRKMDKKAIKAHKKSARNQSSSPLATHRKKVVDSTSVTVIAKSVMISSPIQTTKRGEWAEKGRLQRSCSLDALNDMDDLEIIVSDTEKKDLQIRRSSTEVGTPPFYGRGVSYNPEFKVVQSTKGPRRNRASLHGTTYYESKAHSFKREASRSNPLHEPKSVEHLLEALQAPEVNVNLLDDLTGDAPIHSIIRKKRKDRVELLLALLVNSDVDINFKNRRTMAALHVAIEIGCEMCAKAVIVFGADINQLGCNQFTALDLVIDNGNLPSIESILLELGAKSSTQKIAEHRKKVPRLYSFAEKMRPPMKGERLTPNDNFSEFINRRGITKLYNELEANVRRRMSISVTMGGADDTYALMLQHRELALYNRTQPKPKKNYGTDYGLRGGSRILFLDGGGIKGLVQLEVLIQLEEKTQCNISDLFDWIVGTSTGGVIALAMVYAKKTLRSLRQLYFLLKNRIFMKSRYGFGYNSEALEDILQSYLDPDIKMSDVTHPKILIATVNKATTNLELHFFNNCFGDDYVDYPVWKVARYTSAAPMHFNEFENYVDGGVLCNNPTDYGLTAIQNFCRLRGYKLPIAVVVSVGTGVYPAEKIGIVDAQDALHFGKKWLNPSKLIQKTQNLLSLLSTALTESEIVAENSRSRCNEQDIPFFRFSPKFDEMIASGETDNEKLFNMIIKTKLDLRQNVKQLDELTKIFHDVADSSKDLHEEVIQEDEEEDGVKQEFGEDYAGVKPPEFWEDDAGVKPPEAGEDDAGVKPPEAGEDDAGVKPPEAGEDDAGVKPPEFWEDDAGVKPPEAGEDDAGVKPPEAGEDDAGVKPPEAGEDDAGVKQPEFWEDDAGVKPPEAGEDDAGVKPPEAGEGDAGVKPPEAGEDESMMKPERNVHTEETSNVPPPLQDIATSTRNVVEEQDEFIGAEEVARKEGGEGEGEEEEEEAKAEEPIGLLEESENQSCLHQWPKQFTDNFLFNSIRDKLDLEDVQSLGLNQNNNDVLPPDGVEEISDKSNLEPPSPSYSYNSVEAGVHIHGGGTNALFDQELHKHHRDLPQDEYIQETLV